MRKLREFWQFIKGVFKDRAPYIVIYDSHHSGSNPVLAFVSAGEFGADSCGVFVGDWDGAYEYMKHVLRRATSPRHNIRIAIAGDAPGLSRHPFLSHYYR